jgi:hypothetical protein
VVWRDRSDAIGRVRHDGEVQYPHPSSPRRHRRQPGSGNTGPPPATSRAHTEIPTVPVYRKSGSRRATVSPASQPGARPPRGGRIESPRLVRPRSHEVSELHVHISPASSSSRPHTGVGTSLASSRTRVAIGASEVSRRGLSTAYP